MKTQKFETKSFGKGLIDTLCMSIIRHLFKESNATTISFEIDTDLTTYLFFKNHQIDAEYPVLKVENWLHSLTNSELESIIDPIYAYYKKRKGKDYSHAKIIYKNVNGIITGEIEISDK